MSILIKGMEMPVERQSFTITIQYNGLVLDSETGIPIGEAYELPPHGRLIDADAICAECRNSAEEYDGIYPDCNYCIAHGAPTIIEAEVEAEG